MNAEIFTVKKTVNLFTYNKHFAAIYETSLYTFHHDNGRLLV